MIRLSELLESFETLTPRLKLAIREAERLEAVEEAYDENTQAFLKDNAEPDRSDWQPPPGTEWAIVRSGKTTERWRTRYATSTPWAVSPFYDHAARFETREEAETYIEGHGLTDCQPWPVPLS